MAQVKEIGIFTSVEDGSVVIDIWYVSGRMMEVSGDDFDEAVAALPCAVRREFLRKGAYRLTKAKFGTRTHGQWWQPKGE